MVSRSQRTTTATTKAETSASPTPRSRQAAWDQVSSGELAFDFSLPTEPKSSTLEWGGRDRASVKDAIIRWLDEQL